MTLLAAGADKYSSQVYHSIQRPPEGFRPPGPGHSLCRICTAGQTAAAEFQLSENAVTASLSIPFLRMKVKCLLGKWKSPRRLQNNLRSLEKYRKEEVFRGTAIKQVLTPCVTWPMTLTEHRNEEKAQKLLHSSTVSDRTSHRICAKSLRGQCLTHQGTAHLCYTFKEVSKPTRRPCGKPPKLPSLSLVPFRCDTSSP